MGRQHAAPTAAATQKPGRRSSRRCSREASKNRPSDGTNRTIVYLASAPTPTSSPSAGQAQRGPRNTARWATTKAQPQQQVYGASIVMSEAPAAITGRVRASATAAKAG